MEIMNDISYEVVPDKLLIDSRHPVDVRTVLIKANQGMVKRGTVLSFVEPDLKFVVFGSTLLAGQSAKANCIVAEDANTTSTDSEVAAVVYVSGNYNKNELIVVEGSSLDALDIEDLRAAGIFLSSSN